MGTFVALNQTPPNNNYTLILFDGVCNLCNSSVDFLIKKDTKKKFKFAALQSNTGAQLLPKNEQNLKSLVVITNRKGYTKSRAVLEITKRMRRMWPLLYIFIIIPFFIRDPIYNYLASHRYKWYGKRETCRIPSDAEINRFIE